MSLTTRRLLWLAALWTTGVVVTGAVALVIRMFLKGI